MTTGHRIIAFGEVLWDMLPGGKKLGGAPANFAYHVQQLGACAVVCSRVGNDPLGREIRECFRKVQLSESLLRTDPDLPTGTVQVQLSDAGQPVYEIVEQVAWDHLEVDEDVLQSAATADAIYYGSLALRSQTNRRALEQILAVVPEQAMRVFDLNLRAPFYDRAIIEAMLEPTRVFKFNDEELFVLSEMFADHIVPVLRRSESILCEDLVDGRVQLCPEVQDWLAGLVQWARLDTVILTGGRQGSCLFASVDELACARSGEVEVVDTVGAGDAFTAVCVEGILQHKSFNEIINHASRYAAYICTQSGAMPEVPVDLAQIFD